MPQANSPDASAAVLAIDIDRLLRDRVVLRARGMCRPEKEPTARMIATSAAPVAAAFSSNSTGTDLTRYCPTALSGALLPAPTVRRPELFARLERLGRSKKSCPFDDSVSRS